MNTGIRVGVMKPDPRPVLFEERCPHCQRVMRAIGLGVVGEAGPVLAECECGGTFTITSAAKELDS